MFSFKKTRRMIILAVFSIIMLTSYSFGAKTNVNTGDIPVYEGQTFGKDFIKDPNQIIRMNSQKQLVVYDSGNYCILGLNGELVRKIKPDFVGNGYIFAIGPQDNIYVLVQQRKTENNTQETLRQLYVYSPKGEKLKALDLGKAAVKNGQPNFIWDMAVDSKGVVYVAIKNEGLIVIGKDAKSPKDFSSREFTTIAIDGEDNLIVKGYKSSAYTQFIDKIKMPGGEVVWETELDSGNWINRILYNPADKYIYALGMKHIEKFNSSGKSGGVIFDFFQNNLSAEGLNVDGLIVDPAQNIYLEVTQVETIGGKQTGKSSIKKYTPVLNAKSDKNQKVITIAVPKSWGNFLENACATFRKKHPEIKVNIKEYVNGSSEEAYIEGQKTLNTEIIAGKGADIFGLSSFPYKKYIDKNLLVDLGELLNKEPDLKNKLDMGIFEACKYNGKLFVMPGDIMLPVIFGDQSILDREGIKIDDSEWTWRDFMDIAVKVTKDTDKDGVIDQYALPGQSEISLANYFFNDSSHQFFNYEQKKADFDTPEFRDLLTLCKSAKKLMNPQVDTTKFFQGQGRGSIVFYPGNLGQYFDPVYNREQVFHGKVSMFCLPGSSSKGIAFYANLLYGLNSHSRFKNESWELLKIMLTEELQNNQGMMSFPVNLDVRKGKAEFAMTKLDQIGDQKITQMLTPEELKQIDGLIGRVGILQYFDQQVWTIIYNELPKFFAGEKTTKEVSRIIQNKVETYLNE